MLQMHEPLRMAEGLEKLAKKKKKMTISGISENLYGCVDDDCCWKDEGDRASCGARKP
jgi:hypothetical protein